jgi:hypothetical protein
VQPAVRRGCHNVYGRQSNVNSEQIGSKLLVGVGAGSIAVAVLGTGVATASNGSPIVLGHSNHTTSTTKLIDRKGSPLALVGKKSQPPLTVNSQKMVPHLNAQLLNGKTAGQLASSASTVQVTSPFAGFFGFAKCPTGTHPVGGGILPDPSSTNPGDTPIVVGSFPNITSSNKFNGWDGGATDFDGSYDGTGFIFAYCTSGTVKVRYSAARAAHAQQRVARSAAQTAQLRYKALNKH